MAKCIYGEIEVSFHKNGCWQDLADILLMNGYCLEIKPKEPVTALNRISTDTTITIQIMKEV